MKSFACALDQPIVKRLLGAGGIFHWNLFWSDENVEKLTGDWACAPLKKVYGTSDGVKLETPPPPHFSTRIVCSGPTKQWQEWLRVSVLVRIYVYVTYSLATGSVFKTPIVFPRLIIYLNSLLLQKLFIITVYQTAFNHSVKATSAASFGYHIIFDSLH